MRLTKTEREALARQMRRAAHNKNEAIEKSLKEDEMVVAKAQADARLLQDLSKVVKKEYSVTTSEIENLIRLHAEDAAERVTKEVKKMDEIYDELTTNERKFNTVEDLCASVNPFKETV